MKSVTGSTQSSSRSLASKKSSKNRNASKPLALLPIRTVEHLARTVGCGATELEKWAAEPSRYFRIQDREINGKIRAICQPNSERLKKVLKRLTRQLQRVATSPSNHGGVRGRSARTNAVQHAKSQSLVNCDIKDFYPSVSREMVQAAFVRQLKMTPKVATLLSRICTPFGSLPQGCSHSSVCGSLVLAPMLYRLNRLAQSRNGVCTLYVDDISLSGRSDVTSARELVEAIVRSAGFIPHPEKTLTWTRSQEKAVTGIRVGNGSIDVTSKTLNDLRTAIAEAAIVPPTPDQMRSLQARIRWVSSLNPGVGKQLLRKLKRAVPSLIF